MELIPDTYSLGIFYFTRNVSKYILDVGNILMTWYNKLTIIKGVTTIVEQPEYVKIGSRAVSLLAVAVPLLILIIALLFILWYSWRKFALLRKRLRKEVHEAESALHKAFDLLKEDIARQIKMLEKAKSRRQLTAEEEKIIKQLKKDLSSAEDFVGKEIDDIDKIAKQ